MNVFVKNASINGLLLVYLMPVLNANREGGIGLRKMEIDYNDIRKKKKKFKFSWKKIGGYCRLIAILGVISMFLRPSSDVFFTKFRAGVVIFFVLISIIIDFKLRKKTKK